MAADQEQNDAHHSFHGSCMLSKVTGHKLGVAKKVSPILVRLGKGAQPDDWVRALSLVSVDLGPRPPDDQPADTRAILSMSFQYPIDGPDAPGNIENLIDDMIRLMNELEHKGVFMLTGSGNAGYVSA